MHYLNIYTLSIYYKILKSLAVAATLEMVRYIMYILLYRIHLSKEK